MITAKLNQHRLFYTGIETVEEGVIILGGDQHELRPGTEVDIMHRRGGETPEAIYVLCRYPAKAVPGMKVSHEWMPIEALDLPVAPEDQTLIQA
jgi:hypothetical protein